MTLPDWARCLEHRAPGFSFPVAARPNRAPVTHQDQGVGPAADGGCARAPGTCLVPQKTFGAMSRPNGSITDHVAPGGAGSSPWWLTTWARPSKHLAVSGRWRLRRRPIRSDGFEPTPIHGSPSQPGRLAEAALRVERRSVPHHVKTSPGQLVCHRLGRHDALGLRRFPLVIALGLR